MDTPCRIKGKSDEEKMIFRVAPSVTLRRVQGGGRQQIAANINNVLPPSSRRQATVHRTVAFDGSNLLSERLKPKELMFLRF